MESILEICDALGDISLDECQQILDNPLDSCDHNIDLPDKTLMEQAIPKFRTLKKEITRNVTTINSLKKLCALAVLCITRSDDQEAKILAARLIIVMCSLPSSSAFGIINSNVMLSVLTVINKIIGVELKKVSKNDSTKGNTEGLNMNLQLDTDTNDVEGNKVKHTRSSRHNNSSQTVEDHSSEEEECSADEEDPFATNSRKSRSQLNNINNLKEKLKPQQLFSLLQDIKACITLFASQSDEFILNSCADLFVAIMYLCACKPEYSSSTALCQASLVGFASQNRASLISSYRALMPILSLQTRNPLLPDIAKVRRSCHKAAIAIAVEMIKVTGQAEHLLSVEVSAEPTAEDTIVVDSPGSPVSPAASPILSDRRSSTGSTTSTANATPSNVTTSELPLAHTCIIGVLQRLTLTPPDRAPIRQVVLTSLVELITALGYELLQQEDLHDQVRTAAVRSIEHYLLFLSKLSKSTKVAHRAFSLDITAQLLSTLWLWELPSTNSSTKSTAAAQDTATSSSNDTLCVILLQVLEDRCQDCSPAVRTRALGAIYDLLSTLNGDSSKSMMYAMYDAVMAAKPIHNDENTDETTVARISLIDTLRERTTDDKPQVRTKALQTLSTALSMQWPKPNQDSSNNELTYINMLISEEDIEVFSLHCRDASLSVRKQALFSLTELLISRPANSLLQDIWVQTVLPMTFDAESSVTNKVAETLHTLLFDNLIQWYHTHQQQKNITSTTQYITKVVDLEKTEYTSLVWTLCSKIAAMGMLKILKSALGIMLKQGFLTAAAVTKSDFKSSSVLAIITVLKYACCIHIDSTTTDTSMLMELSEDNRQTMQNRQETEEIARGAWILLEGIVSLEAMTILNTKQEPVKFRDFIQQAGSADFVIRCYRQKHSVPDNMHVARWDEEDLRIFKVLESLGGNLSEKDSVYIKQEIIENLQCMQCECHIAAAAIAVLHQLSKTEVADALTAAYASTRPSNQVLVDSIKLWSAPLLRAVHTVLHMYALRTSLVDNEKVIGCSNNNSVQHLLLDWIQETAATEHADTSLTLDLSTLPSNTTTHSLTSQVLESVQTALFILGEVSMLGFSMEEDHFLGNQNAKKVDEAHASTKSASQFRLAVDPAVIALVKILMGHSLPVTNTTTSNGIVATVVHRECPNKIRANAFVTMGKLCLRNKTLAREHVNIYLREVSQQRTSASGSGTGMDSTLNMSAITARDQMNQSNASQLSLTAAAAAVRSNALLVLGDLCIRYTNLVDRHVDTMAQCLQDSDSNVRKNALILLTQLLLQDFLKWKGFLLYRFLLLTVDSDSEIAEFSRNILQKTLKIKYPQLLTDHFTEALVILNNCTAHPAYTSIIRTGSTTIEEGVQQSTTTTAISTTATNNSEDSMLHTDEMNANIPEAAVFTCSLSKADRFSIYAFMAESLDDEMKIQISAKIVQDILSAAVDNAALLPSGSQKAGNRDKDRFQAFECVLDDALTLLRSPHLKVGTKKASEDNDETAEDDLHDPTTTTTTNNTKTAFIRAKTKILQKLSTQHLVSHTLPVVISLKHCLETTKSSLQGALMEFLISLIKYHKNEVEEALQFDPTLRAEIEYDLKQFERSKKEKLLAAVNAQLMSTRKSPHHSLRAPSTAKKPLSPYLDLQQLPSHSIVKPSLRKSFGGQASRGRTPYDALKSPGLGLARSAVRSALAGSGGRFQDEGDDLDRLTFSQQDAAATTADETTTTDSTGMSSTSKVQQPVVASEMWDVNCATQKLFADEDEHAPAGSTFMSSHKQSRRRSWGVVVDSLLPGISPVVSGTGSNRSSLGSTATGTLHSPIKDRSSPPKKKRCRKSNSPNKPLTASSHKAVSFSAKLTAPELSTQQAATENIPPTACNTVNPSTTTVENDVGNKVVKRGGGGRSRAAAALNSSNTLLSASLAARTVDGDEAVNAFDRLLATASQSTQVHTTTTGAGRRMGKRGSTQQGDSLMGLL